MSEPQVHRTVPYNCHSCSVSFASATNKPLRCFGVGYGITRRWSNDPSDGATRRVDRNCAPPPPFAAHGQTACSLSRQRKRKAECYQNNDDHHANTGQNGADHPADSSPVCRRTAAWVHCSCSHCLQVTVTHDPRGNAGEDPAKDQTKNTKNQDQRASMWFHIFVFVQPCLGGLWNTA